MIKMDNFVHYDVRKSDNSPYSAIRKVLEDRKNNIWIGTDGAGLDLFDPKTGKFEHYLNDSKNPSSLSNNYIISLYEDTKNRLWVGTYQGGLNKMISQTKMWKHYLQGEIEQGSDIRVIFEDKKGKFVSPTSDSERVKITENTTSISMNIISFSGIVDLELQLRKLKELLIQFTDAEGVEIKIFS